MPIQAVLCALDYQELCEALGLMEGATAPSRDDKPPENPCPEELAVLALPRRAQTPILVPRGVMLTAGIPR